MDLTPYFPFASLAELDAELVSARAASENARTLAERKSWDSDIADLELVRATGLVQEMREAGNPRPAASDERGAIVALQVNGIGQATEIGEVLCREAAGAPYCVYGKRYPGAFAIRYTILYSTNPRYKNGQAVVVYARGADGEYKRVSF